MTKNNSKKLWVKSLTTLGAMGIVGTCILPSISSCAKKDDPNAATAKFNDKKESIPAFTETDIATITFTNVENIDDVSYEFAPVKEYFIQLEHKIKDGKHFITAKSEPWLLANPKMVDITVKASYMETVIGEMSLTIAVMGQQSKVITQPKDFTHTVGQSIETICLFEIPALYKDAFTRYIGDARDASSGDILYGYKLTQNANVGEALSFKLTTDPDYFQEDSIRQIYVNVTGMGSGPYGDVFRSEPFTATVILPKPVPAVEITYSGSTFDSYKTVTIATMKLTDISFDDTKLLSFAMKADDQSFMKLSYAWIDGKHCVQAQIKPLTGGDKTIPDAIIAVTYRGNVIGNSEPTTLTIKSLAPAFDPISPRLTGDSGSTIVDYLTLNFGPNDAVKLITDTIVYARQSPDGPIQSNYLVNKNSDLATKQTYSLTLPTVSSERIQGIFFEVAGNYVDFDGKKQSIILCASLVVSITTKAPITK